MADTENDIDELERWVRVMNDRGHASIFARDTPADRRIVELSTAEEWCTSVRTEFGLEINGVCSNDCDPPDCYAWLNGQRVSLELTELVDGEILSKIQKAAKDGHVISAHHGDTFVQAQWSKQRLGDELNHRIRSKAKKYLRNNESVDVLIVHTDEPWLNPHQIKDWLADVDFEQQSVIQNAFLLLTYSPGYADHWPVFRLFGSL